MGKRICTIEGCERRAHARGWCHAHYGRYLRNGDPLAGGTPCGDPARFLNENVLTYDGDDCVAWPYNTNSSGYGRIWRDGADHFVHRIVCEYVNGPAPTPKHEAAHSCGKGHLACVTKSHLSWKTRTENFADKIEHGTAIRGDKCSFAKLSEADARTIQHLKGSMSQREIAAHFGVSRSTVGLIQAGKRWAWLEAV